MFLMLSFLELEWQRRKCSDSPTLCLHLVTPHSFDRLYAYITKAELALCQRDSLQEEAKKHFCLLCWTCTNFMNGLDLLKATSKYIWAYSYDSEHFGICTLQHQLFTLRCSHFGGVFASNNCQNLHAICIIVFGLLWHRKWNNLQRDVGGEWRYCKGIAQQEKQ